MNRSKGEAELRQLASLQHGVITRAQAAQVGLDRHQLRRLVGSGRWRALGRIGLALVGTPETDLYICAAALRTHGGSATLSHETAAAFWGLAPFRSRPVHLLVRHGRNPMARPGTIIHQARRLLPHHVVDIEGLRVTSPPRTVFDLSGTLTHRWRIEETLDGAWASRLVGFDSMMTTIDELSGHGQRNVAELREMVLTRGPAHVAGESALERRFHQIIREAGLPPMSAQVDLTDEEGWWGRVDALYPDARIIVEIDGERWHSALRHRQRDTERRQRWSEMGYLVLSFSDREVWHRRDYVVTEVRRARRERLDLRVSA